MAGQSLDHQTLSYDGLGNLSTVSQLGVSGESPRTRISVYDSLSRLTNICNPESISGSSSCSANGPWSVVNGYDSNGNLTISTDARGIGISYSYDALNRLTDKQSSGATGVPGFHYGYAYDTSNLGTFTASNPIGRLVEASNLVNTSEQYSYDAMGRIAFQGNTLPSTCCIPGTQNSVQVQYDLAGNVTSLTYPDGRVVTQSFDNGGHQLTSTFDSWNGQHVGYQYAGMTYTPAGDQAEIWLGNAYIHTPYNNRQRMCQVWANSFMGLVDTHIYYGGSTTFCNSAPGDNGNVTQVKDWKNPNRTRYFGYDSLNRLDSFAMGPAPVSPLIQQSYSMDSFGNLKQSGSMSYLPNYGTNNQIIGYGYDSAGNLTSYNDGVSTKNLQFDAENKLTNFNGIATYTYEPIGNRSRKDTTGTWTEYVNFNGQPLAERSSDGVWTDYIYANGQKIARVDGHDNRIHTHGVFTTSGNELRWNLPIPSNPDGSQYTVQTGDQLCVRQFESNAVGGPAVFYSDGSMSTWDGRWSGSDGQEMNQMSGPQNQWVFRCADVSLGGAKTGMTLTALSILTDVNTQAGTWDIYYGDMAIVSTDGSVRPVIGPTPPTPTVGGFQGGGWTGTPTAIVEAPMDYAPDNVTVHYFIPDHLGTAREELTAGGWPMWQGEYYPFGQESYSEPTANNFKFATLERDQETGLDHARFRQFSSTSGRWMSPDPYNGSMDLRYPQTLNRYAYVGNIPLGYTDPSGLDGDPIGGNPVLGAGGCVGAATGNPIAAIGCGIFLISEIFNHPSFQGSLKPRPNAQPWDEYHIHYGANIPGALGLPGDPGCEFGACGSSFTDYGQQATANQLQTASREVTAGRILGLYAMKDHSCGECKYDYGWNEHASDTWNVCGQILNADQMGNFMAGYQAGVYDDYYRFTAGSGTASAAVLGAGVVYHMFGRTKAKGDWSDKTGRPDILRGRRFARGGCKAF